ncbi:unnamed protein product [Phytophthora lilii]|uniref:Unnamed protein product n=1 Tax=Phytophthora lilii TaxID=2077276 RepID=A0A9W6YE12_9STRA|nr:unnamed protein product [Phytophthora lilii]
MSRQSILSAFVVPTASQDHEEILDDKTGVNSVQASQTEAQLTANGAVNIIVDNQAYTPDLPAQTPITTHSDVNGSSNVSKQKIIISNSINPRPISPLTLNQSSDGTFLRLANNLVCINRLCSVCPVCRTTICLILPHTGQEEETYWSWVLATKPSLPSDFTNGLKKAGKRLSENSAAENRDSTVGSITSNPPVDTTSSKHWPLHTFRGNTWTPTLAKRASAYKLGASKKQESCSIL